MPCARPYIGELSITEPPAATSASTTVGKFRVAGAIGRLVDAEAGAAALITGRASPVEGIGRV